MSTHLSRRAHRASLALRHAAARTVVLLALFLGFAGIAPAAGQAAGATVTTSDLCRAWSASDTNPQVTLASGYRLTAARLVRHGSSCSAPGASVDFATSAAITQVATTGATGSAASRLLAAVAQAATTPEDLKVGDEAFAGAKITSLSFSLSGNGLGISGGLEIAWSGGTTTKMEFSGTFRSLSDYSITLKSPAGGTLLPNVGGAPVTFSGTYDRAGSTQKLSLTGAASSLSFGTGDRQLSLTNAVIELTLADEQTGKGLRLAARGNIALGSAASITNAVVNAEFDGTGLLSVQGSGTINASVPASATTVAGRVIGTAKFAFQRGGEPSVTFKGAARFGDALVGNVAGTADAQSVSFSGSLQFAQTDFAVKAAIEGSFFYGSNLAGRTVANRAGTQVQAQKGDAVLTSASATITTKNLAVSGSVQVGTVGGKLWARGAGDVDLSFQPAGQPETTVKGSATVSWAPGEAAAVTFKGSLTSGSTTVASAEGSVDGSKISLKGTVKLSNPDLTIEGAVDGVYYYADGSADQLSDRSGAKVSAKKGDFVLRSVSATITSKGFTLSGAASIARVGGDRWASGGGSVDLTYGETRLTGKAELTWSAGEIPAVTFSGTITQGSSATIAASGTVDGSALTIKGNATLSTGAVTIKGAVDGTLYYGTDLAGKTITDASGKQVPASKGDYIVRALSGSATYGTLALSGDGAFANVAGSQWATVTGALDLTSGATRVTGSATLAWASGKAPSVSFTGSVKSGDAAVVNASGTIDSSKIELKGDGTFTAPELSISGAIDGIVYYGDPAGATLPGPDGSAIPAKKGDFLLRSASGSATVKNLALTASATIGNVGGTLYGKGSGTVDLTLSGTNVKGSAAFTWSQSVGAAVSFDGTVKVGTTITVNASGTLDGKKIALKGDATIKEAAFTATGSLDGVYYYGDPAGDQLEGPAGTPITAQKGDFLLRGASAKIDAKGITVTGTLAAGNVGGTRWAKGSGAIDVSFGTPTTRIKGSATFTWNAGGAALSFEGAVTQAEHTLTASGAFDGKKLQLSGALSSPTLSGKATGTVYYGSDLAGETVTSRSGTTVPASPGDFVVSVTDGKVVLRQLTATASFTLRKVGTLTWAKADAQIQVGSTFLTFSGELDSTGAINLKGSGNTVLGGYKVAFSGSAIVQNGALTLSGTADVTTGLFGVRLSGTILKPNMSTSDFTFIGSANFRFGAFNVVGATVRLTSQEGMATTFQVSPCLLFLCTSGTYKLYFSGPNLSRIQLSAPVVAWPVLFASAKIAAPGVPVETSITGIV